MNMPYRLIPKKNLIETVDLCVVHNEEKERDKTRNTSPSFHVKNRKSCT